MLVRMPHFLGIAIVSFPAWVTCMSADCVPRRCAVWDVAGGSGEEFLLQDCWVGPCPLPFCKVGHDTVTVKMIAIILWTLFWKAAIPSLFQRLSWCLSGIQGWRLWLFYSVLALAVSGGEVASLPCVHTSLLSVLTILFFSEVLTPRIREA